MNPGNRQTKMFLCLNDVMSSAGGDVNKLFQLYGDAVFMHGRVGAVSLFIDAESILNAPPSPSNHGKSRRSFFAVVVMALASIAAHAACVVNIQGNRVVVDDDWNERVLSNPHLVTTSNSCVGGGTLTDDDRVAVVIKVYMEVLAEKLHPKLEELAVYHVPPERRPTARGIYSVDKHVVHLLSDPDSEVFKNTEVIIHELAHAVHLKHWNVDFDRRLNDLWRQTGRRGVWIDKYMMSDHMEFWAEASVAFLRDVVRERVRGDNTFAVGVISGLYHLEVPDLQEIADEVPALYEILQSAYPGAHVTRPEHTGRGVEFERLTTALQVMKREREWDDPEILRMQMTFDDFVRENEAFCHGRKEKRMKERENFERLWAAAK